MYFSLVSFFFFFFLPYSLAPSSLRLARAACFSRPLLFSISPAIEGARVHRRYTLFLAAQKGLLAPRCCEGRTREKNRGPTEFPRDPRHVTRYTRVGVFFSPRFDQRRRPHPRVLPPFRPAEARVAAKKKKKKKKKKDSLSPRDSIWRRPRDGIVEMAWPHCSVSRLKRDERRRRAPAVEHRSSSLPLLLFHISTFSFPLFDLSLCSSFRSAYSSSTVSRLDMWRMKEAGQPTYTRETIFLSFFSFFFFFFLSRPALCFRARATFQYRIVVLKIRGGNDGVT